jgi:hypothetical protein
MGSLYFMRLAASGQQFGLIYIGNGIIAGADTSGVTYDGTYVLENERFKGSVMVTQSVANRSGYGGGETPPLVFDWPEDLQDGQHDATWGQQAVKISLRKLRDLP